MDDVVLELQHISKALDGQLILDDVNLTLKSGQVHGLFGSNGAGKSVLVRLISGLLRPDQGTILIDGSPCCLDGPKDAQQLGITTIFQTPNLIPNFTVAENLCLGSWPKKKGGAVDWQKINKEAEENLKMLGGNIPPSKQARQLNFGQQRIVEMAKAFRQKARIVILDEPDECLNEQEIKAVLKTVKRFRDLGLAIIYISHNVSAMTQLCDIISIMNEGHIVDTLMCKCDDRGKMILDSLSSITYRRQYPRIFSGDGRVLLEAKEISTDRGIQNISLKLRKGEVLGIAGFLGSGRSALARALFGVDPLTGGSIEMNGIQLRLGSPEDALKKGIGYIADDSIDHLLLDNLTTSQNITLANIADILHFGKISLKRELEVFKHFNDQLFICTEKTPKKPSELSGGTKHKVLFSRWLFANCHVLIMDEPTNNIDKSGKVEIYNIINKFILDGNSVILISSNFDELLGMSDHILVLQNGKIVKEFSKKDFSIEAILESISGAGAYV